MAQSRPKEPAVARVVNDFDEAKGYHDLFVQKIEQHYKSWRGILEIRSAAAQWTSKLHPPYINHITETTVASLVDDELRFRVRPTAKLSTPPTPGEIGRLKEGAKAWEIMLRYQLAQADFEMTQRPFVLQNLIAGMSGYKCYWVKNKRKRKRLQVERVIVRDDYGMPIDSYPVMRPVEMEEADFDGPYAEVLDMRDFVHQEAAVSLDRAPWIIHRMWMTYDELKDLEKQEIYRNVDKLKESRSFGGELASRENDLFQMDRTKDMIEVLEYWSKHDRRVISVGNRAILLRDEEWPFWHADYPFVTCATQADLFRVGGVSQVQKIEHLQEMKWKLGNQRIDNVELLNNAVYFVPDDLDDLDVFGDIGPGSIIPMADPGSVQPWTPNPLPADISLGAESIIVQEMQNLAGGLPFTSTAEARTIQANTATEASLVTSLAQLALKLQKSQIRAAQKKVGRQFMRLDEQFIRVPQVVNVIGADNDYEWYEVFPEMLQGDWDFEIDPMSESLMRSEKRAEAQALYQVALAAAPIHAALSQGGAAKMINMDALWEDLLHSHDIQDTERYFVVTPPQTAVPGQPGQPQPGQNGQGVTSPLATAQQQPSNPNSMSPALAMQQMLASQGGVANT